MGFKTNKKHFSYEEEGLISDEISSTEEAFIKNYLAEWIAECNGHNIT